MDLGFLPARKRGTHFKLAMLAVRRLRNANLSLKGKTERHFEHSMVATLQASWSLRKNLITQIGEDEVEKITQSSLFGFKHRPDTTIGNDGTAIELKVVTSSSAIRDLLGQAIAYRMSYRFVVLALVDHTPDRHVVATCQDRKSREHALLTGLADQFNIFTVVGPVPGGKNLAFIAAKAT
jgi:hypothetical protein